MDSRRVFNIIGLFAPQLMQEVTNAMASGGDIGYILTGMHIHPALNELVEAALGNLGKTQVAWVNWQPKSLSQRGAGCFPPGV